MKLLYQKGNNISNLIKLIEEEEIGDYIYMYPPRQSYYELSPSNAFKLAVKSIKFSNEINLYLHIPFCKQICSFCNLFTKVSTKNDEQDRYVKLLLKELTYYKDYLKGKKVNSIYIGGGTPSLLSISNFELLINDLESNLGINICDVPEVALEVAPDTVDEQKFVAINNLGINRVNLGFQSVNDLELKAIGRKHGALLLHDSFESIKKIGFKNVCVDLIYGLQNQSICSWEESLSSVIDYAPETICIYPLTLRPATPYFAKGYRSLSNYEQYEKYDLAVEKLKSAGYEQETHIRFRIDNGGYKQKANHWKLQNILGLGAGSRSYFWHCDTRNNYGALTRDKAYNHYVSCIESDKIPITDGYVMSKKERMAKAVILNLIRIDRNWFNTLFGVDVLQVFPSLVELANLELLEINMDEVCLTKQGLKYRDLIVQLFFTKKVKNNILNYAYND